MSEKQRLKHIADREATKNVPEFLPISSSLLAADPTPDGLGSYNGGPFALRGSNRWVADKSRGSRTGNAKNAPGTDYASKISHRQDKDFNEIHTDANGNFFLYNVKSDAWDIPTDPQTLPFYEDENDVLWAYNYRTGAWDVTVVIEYDVPEVAPLLIEESDNVPCDTVEEFTDVNPEVVS